jgi:hypothetical protein
MRRTIPVLVLCLLLSGCGPINTLRGMSDLRNENYDLAIEKCSNAIESYDSLTKPIIGIHHGYTYNAKYNTTMCLAAAYFAKGDFEKSKEFWLKNIDYFPQKGYVAYSSLATIAFLSGNLEDAYQYSKRGRTLVESADYAVLSSGETYYADLWKDALISSEQYYRMRLNFQLFTDLFEAGNYQKAIEIGNAIVGEAYLVHSGARSVGGTTVTSVEKGSLEDLNGLLPGDKILELDGLPAHNQAALVEFYQKMSHNYGSSLSEKVERKGRIIPLELRLQYPEVETTRKKIAEGESLLAAPLTGKRVAGPWVKVLEPKSSGTAPIGGREETRFRILASDVDPLSSVVVNGIPCTRQEPGRLEATMLPGKVGVYTISLRLAKGENKYAIVATNRRGKKASEQIVVSSTLPVANVTPIYRHRVAVLIGINRYTSWPNLEFAVNDAKSVRDKLTVMGFDKIVTIFDKDATRARIMRVLADDLPGMMTEDDCLLVYFAGHGATEELSDNGKEGYLIPVDGDDENYRGTGISMSSVHEMIKRYRSKHILFVFDSCYSGLGLMRSGAKTDKKATGFIKSMAKKPVSLILTAGGKDEQAGEAKGHGIFTRSFLDALNGKAPLAENGFILASDVAQQVRKRVFDLSHGKQIPQFGALSGEGDFIFELY